MMPAVSQIMRNTQPRRPNGNQARIDSQTQLLAKRTMSREKEARGRPTWMDTESYYPALDGLRGIAVLMVVYGHAGYWGWVPLLVGCATIGVVLFFFLSGFLMGHHYTPDAAAASFDRPTLRYWSAFLFRRFLRVYPPYLLAPIVGYILLMTALPPDFEHSKPFSDLHIVDEISRIAFFDGELGIYWTIKEELRFYLLYPLGFLLFSVLGRRVLAVFLIVVALMAVNHFARVGADWPGYVAIFAAGVFTSHVVGMQLEVPAFARHANMIASGSLLAFAILVFVISRASPTQHTIWQLDWLFALLFLVLFASLLRSDGALRKALSWRISVLIGRMSFSLYLVHIIGFHLTRKYLGWSPNMMIAACIVLAALTLVYYLAVERWFVLLSKRISVRT